MYDFEPRTRNLIDCDLDTHVKDFETVVNALRKLKVTRIFAVGHSYGGITILRSKAKLDAVVLWDPSHGLAWEETNSDEKDYAEFPELTVRGLLIGTGGYGYVDTEENEEFFKTLGDNTNWSSKKGYPLKIISAGKGVLKNYNKMYIDVADVPKKYVVIKNASHQFGDSDEVMFELFEETGEWFKKYQNHHII